MAEIFALPDQVIIRALTPLDVAAWTATDAILSVDHDASERDLGEAVAATLSESRTAPPTVDNASGKALLKAARVRSRTALVRKARYVTASQDGGGAVLLLPGAPGRRGGGWITVAHEEGIVVDDPSQIALGRAVKTAIERSTTTPVDD